MKEEVLKHYEDIADEFTDISNEYCNQRYLQEISKYVKSKFSILELGCGTGLLLSKLKAKQRTGCDLSPKLIKQFKHKNIKLVQGDAEKLSFESSKYDLVFHVNLLEHVPNPSRVVQEANRVLKKGGKQIIITPNGDIGWLLEIAEKLKLKTPEGPHKFLTTKTMKELLYGLPISVISSSKFILFPKGPKFILNTAEKLEKFIPLGFFHLFILKKD